MSGYRYTIYKLLRDWALIVAMLVGVAAYFLYRALPSLHPLGPTFQDVLEVLQPLLLFVMMFLSFTKIEPSQLRPHKWMLWLLLFQCLSFVLLAVLIVLFPSMKCTDAVESAMLCLICPTATACAVVTGKLGGNMAGVITYTVLINLAAAVLVPLVLPLINPLDGVDFAEQALRIMGKVFPMLILPCLLAWLVRYLLPGLHAWLLKYSGVSFYIWAISLCFAVLISTRAIYHNASGAFVLVEAGAASLLCCALQFVVGRRIGSVYACPISAGQALGQKNTVFGIWMGYSFFSPAVSIAGGFYSIWHNCYNSYQLYRRRKSLENSSSDENN